jgi:hypothetical protein
MFDNLAGYLKIDPLLAAAVILAVTLVVGRAVDAVRAYRQQAKDTTEKGQMEIGGPGERGEISAATDS